MLKLLFIAITAATAATAAAAAKAAIFSKKSAQDNYVNTTVSERIYPDFERNHLTTTPSNTNRALSKKPRACVICIMLNLPLMVPVLFCLQ